MIRHSNLSPEEVELKQKQEILSQKQSILAELELTLTTLQANLKSFEIEYFLKVGSRYVELDELQALLDQILASKKSSDPTAKRKAQESRQRAEESAKDAKQFKGQDENGKQKFKPTTELREIYRELAKLVHPDLTLDPVEKARRHGLMQQINEAYQNGDMAKLEEILDIEKHNPESIKGDDVSALLVKTIRKIAQVEKRIKVLEKELETFRKSDLYILYETVNREREKGKDLLGGMSKELNDRVYFLRQQIERMKTIK